MADYISREAAIEELRKAADCANCDAGAGGLCGFCDIENAARLINGIPAADVEPANRWIPCSERLPEQEGTYIVVTNKVKPVVTTARFYPARDLRNYKGNVFGHEDAHFQANRYVTHWMPMPELPEE